jgi:AcrR family transcriptional regulator
MLLVIAAVKEASVTSVRDQMVVGAAELLSRAGLAEASLRNVVAHTGAPRGSIYHHFPGGKDELVREAMHWIGGRLIGALRRTPFEGPDDVVVAFAGLFRRLLVDSEAEAGCAVAAVVSGSVPGTASGAAAAEVLRSWRRELEGLFATAGVPAGRRKALAVMTVATVEGALVLARADGDVATYDAAVTELVRLVRS